VRSVILSTAALSLAALAQGCIASAEPAHLVIALYLFLGGLILFILAFAGPLRRERRTIWWKALLALPGLFLASLAYFCLTQGEHFLLAVAFSLLLAVFLGGTFGQEDESGEGRVARGAATRGHCHPAAGGDPRW